MGMSSSQPQPITQGTMGSPRGTGGGMPMADPSSAARAGQMGVPTKSYGPVGGMVSSAQNQVNPQPPVDNSSLQPNAQWGMTSQVPIDNTTRQPQVGQPPRSMGNPGFMPMGNAGFMPMGNAGFMPMGNHNFMPMGFGQMPTFGGPRGGKAPQGGGNPPQAMGGDPYVMGANPNTGRQVRAGYQGGPQTVAYQKQATDNYDGFYSVPYAYDPSIAKSDYGKIGAGNLGASAGFA